MKPKQLAILAAAAVILVGLALLTQRRDAAPPERVGTPVLEAFDLNAVTAMVISTPDATNRLARKDGVWGSAANYDYPADFERLRGAVRKLAELRVGQVIDADDEARMRMRMLSPAEAAHDAAVAGTLVELFDDDGARLAALLIGGQRSGSGEDGPMARGTPDGQYVSPDEGQTVFVVAEPLFEFNQAGDWLDRDLLNVPSTDIEAVTIVGPERAPVSLRMPEGGNALELTDLAADETMDTTHASSIRAALSYLRLDRVADPALDDSETGMDQPVAFMARTSAGVLYTVKLGKAADGGGRYARIDAEVTLNPTPRPEETEAAATDADADAGSERRALKQTIQELNRKLAPWTFVLSEYKADQLTTRRDELIKAPEPPENDPASETGLPDTDAIESEDAAMADTWETQP